MRSITFTAIQPITIQRAKLISNVSHGKFPHFAVLLERAMVKK